METIHPGVNSVSATPSANMVTLSHVIYGLHAFSAVTGLLSPAFVVTAFLTGWPSLIAVVLNYLNRDKVRGTRLESHFTWQIRTFWFALLWVVVVLLLAFTVLGVPLAFVVALGTGAWVLYRIARGWVRLFNDLAAPGGN